jgi:hypothetical protein
MIAADVVRALAIGALARTVVIGRAAVCVIATAAFVEGRGAVLFSGAQSGALRAVVPARQLPTAVATRSGRQAAVQLAGPPLGGVLFSAARALPFLVDAVSYAFRPCRCWPCTRRSRSSASSTAGGWSRTLYALGCCVRRLLECHPPEGHEERTPSGGPALIAHQEHLLTFRHPSNPMITELR